MKMLLILGVGVSVVFSTPAFSLGPGTGSHSSASGGISGSNAARPGTNSLGTALSSSGHGGARRRGVRRGTGNPAVDREDKRVQKIVRSICRGC